MYKKQAEAVKEWLQAYRANEERINRQLEKIRMIRGRMMSVGAQMISDMPKGGGNSCDQMADYVIQVESLERAVQEDIRVQEQCRKTILDLIKLLEKAEERKVIQLRYLDGYDWNDVMSMIYRREPKYAQKMDAYRRRMYRAHEEALDKMAKRWIKHGT